MDRKKKNFEIRADFRTWKYLKEREGGKKYSFQVKTGLGIRATNQLGR